jgi:hypothetical protein
MPSDRNQKLPPIGSHEHHGRGVLVLAQLTARSVARALLAADPAPPGEGAMRASTLECEIDKNHLSVSHGLSELSCNNTLCLGTTFAADDNPFRRQQPKLPIGADR